MKNDLRLGLPDLGVGVGLRIPHYQAIFANLEPAMFAPLVDTKAELASVVEPSTTIARDPSKWRTSTVAKCSAM